MSERVDRLVAELTLDEKAALTAGQDQWSTPAVDRLGIPKIRTTDGSNGARGTHMGTSGPTAVCVPCGSALGATWDPDLVERVGSLLGREALTKSCRILLGPTVNLHRSPLAGRNFECYSEDPYLSGALAAGFVRGLQSQGVAPTVKHFVANDAEFQRHTISSVVDERTLRELYLLPFEMAVRDGGALGIMTSYNRLNGKYLTCRPEILDGILRDEWGFEGFVLTDWDAFVDTVESGQAGLDLEMPGPPRAFGPQLAQAVRDGLVPEHALDAKVRRFLTVMDRLGALPEDTPGPGDGTGGRVGAGGGVTDGAIDDGAGERSEDRPEDRALAREAAAAGMVLLRNDGVLPLDPKQLRRVAVIGMGAARAQIMGGGSAEVRAHYRVTPLEAIRQTLGPDVEVVWEPGCDIDLGTPLLRSESLQTGEGSAGLKVEFFAAADLSGPAVAETTAVDTRFFWIKSPLDGVPDEGFSARIRGRFSPQHSGAHVFTLAQFGRARVWVDGALVLDGVTDPPPFGGDDFFGLASLEAEATVELEAQRPVDLVIEYSTDESFTVHGVRVGCRPPVTADLMEQAVSTAAAADVAIVIASTTSDWETEERDRTSMNLPGLQEELITRVGQTNPRTVVAVNTGTAVAMGWSEAVGAVVQTWFAGQEMAGALAGILFGELEPGGRLPFSIPELLEHNPSFGNFPGSNGEVRYGEGLLVGYRWYQSRRLPVRYPFGHGLSYTSFDIGRPEPDALHFQPGERLVVEVPVTNIGGRAGSEVVQCYVCPPPDGPFRPPAELKAFAKVQLAPGESARARLELDDRSFAYWEPDGPAWRIHPGRYRLAIGRSSHELLHHVEVDVIVDGSGGAPG